jgi:hypothetical protein
MTVGDKVIVSLQVAESVMRVNAALPSLPELQQEEEHHHAAFQLTSATDDAACLELKAVVADCFKVNAKQHFRPFPK